MSDSATCSCVRCEDCRGHGTVWFDVGGQYLGARRCDDCDTMESCEECRGSGVSETCAICMVAYEEAMNDDY